MHRRTLIFREPLAAIARPGEAPPPAPPAPVTPALVADDRDAVALRALVASLGMAVSEMRSRQTQTAAEIARASVELGIAVAGRLIGAGIAANRQRLDAIVRQSLERMPSAASVTVRAHPDDAMLLHEQLGEESAAVTIRPDAGLSRGQVKLETDEWFVTWDTQRSLSELRDALLEETFTDS